MNDGQKSVVLNYETVAVTNTRDRDFVFHPNDRSRALSIIRGLWNVEAMQAIVIEGEEALLRLRDLLLAMVPLGYEALVEAEKAEAGNRLVKVTRYWSPTLDDLIATDWEVIDESTLPIE